MLEVFPRQVLLSRKSDRRVTVAAGPYLVQMLQGKNDLPNVDPNFLLREVVSLVKMGKHLPTTNIV